LELLESRDFKARPRRHQARAFNLLLSGGKVVLMAAAKEQDPTFEPRKAENGIDYSILVTWPDGRTEQVSGIFKDETAALDWIRVGSRAWVARRQKSN
jgi:hypothetical protein